MMGSVDSIDLSLKNVCKSWFAFRRGKRATEELHDFQYHLEKNLVGLFWDLNSGRYCHGGYRKFVVCDNKRREISVASVRDRVVHRLVYDFLVRLFDRTFIYDAWSCRKGKGLLGAIERTQEFLKRYESSCAGSPRTHTHTHTHTHTPRSHYSRVWKCDVKKFFDSVDQEILLRILTLRIKDRATLNLLKEIIFSFTTVSDDRVSGGKVGMPIGNLTSQIFANLYLNELDRFVKHPLGAAAYLRYGDDFIVVENDLERLNYVRDAVVRFLEDELKLQVNPKSDKIVKVSHGLKFLGVTLWPSGRRLYNRNLARVNERLGADNVSSYSGLVKKHANAKRVKYFNWLVCERILDEQFIWFTCLY